MNTLTFKTNLKCSGCVDTVTPFLNKDEGIENWNVDLASPQKTLQVETSHTAGEIKDLMKRAGYNAEEIA
jgi:copper chaperone